MSFSFGRVDRKRDLWLIYVGEKLRYFLILGRGLNTYTQTTGGMSGGSEGTDEPAQSENSRDEVIRKRSFSRARGIDISTFMVDVEEKTDEVEPVVNQKPPGARYCDGGDY